LPHNITVEHRGGNGVDCGGDSHAGGKRGHVPIKLRKYMFEDLGRQMIGVGRRNYERRRCERLKSMSILTSW
jgi:hypothetical protein